MPRVTERDNIINSLENNNLELFNALKAYRKISSKKLNVTIDEDKEISRRDQKIIVKHYDAHRAALEKIVDCSMNLKKDIENIEAFFSETEEDKKRKERFLKIVEEHEKKWKTKIKECCMKIEVFEIASQEDDAVYRELLEQYKTNEEVKTLLDKYIFDSPLIWAGDFSLIAMLKYAIGTDSIRVFLVKDVDADTFLWVIGQFLDDNKKLSMYPLLDEQSKELQLAIRSALVEKGIFKEPLPGE